MKKRLLSFALLNIVIFVLTLFFISPPAFAQDNGNKPSPIDRYPLPNTPNSLAYKLGDRWPKTDLTYTFLNCPTSFDCPAAHDSARRAFQDWQTVSPLVFTEVESGADIEIMWSNDTSEGLGVPGDILAFAYFPSDGGDIFMDDAEPWTIGQGDDTDHYLTVLHEIGHSLGLDHSDDESAVMYAYSGGAIGLTEDDIAGIQALYGTPDNPNTDIDLPANPIPDEPTDDELTGVIDDETPYEFWEVEAFAGENLYVTMTDLSSDLDPYLVLLDEDDNVLTESADDDRNGVVELAYTIDEDGIYWVVATRFDFEDGISAGPYELIVEFSTEPVELPPTDDFVAWDIVNYTETDVCYLYISPSTSDDWGEDFLEGDFLPDGDGIFVELDSNGTYDILVETCDGDFFESYSITSQRDVYIEVYSDGIYVE